MRVSNWIEIGITISLHLLGWGVVLVAVFWMVTECLDQMKAIWDRSFWDARQAARIELGQQMVSDQHWLRDKDERILLDAIGQHIIRNGSFNANTFRDDLERAKKEPE